MGREPEQNSNPYYNPKIVWFLAVLVGVAVIVVGLTILSDKKPLPLTDDEKDSVTVDSIPSETTIPSGIEDEKKVDSVFTNIKWRKMNQGLKEAQSLKSYAMIYFSSPDCEPCREFELKTLSLFDFERAIAMPIVPIKIDAESNDMIEYAGRKIRESSAADFFGISGFPTLLFYDGSDKRFLFALNGKQSYSRLNRTLEFIEKELYLDSNISLKDYISAE